MVDVTRTFCVGAPSAFQRDLHQVVLHAQQRAVAACVPGAEWKEVHLGAARDMVQGLVDMGVMRGGASALVERNAHMLFFPHGVGHMVGLGVRDGSGNQPGRAKDPRPCLENLRMDLPLAEGYVLTVEPGLYFIPYLLRDVARRERHRDDVNWALVDEHLHVGGVRIEDSVHVTASGPENLTAAISKAL
jgi:Xaa-Pro aminopeptidase